MIIVKHLCQIIENCTMQNIWTKLIQMNWLVVIMWLLSTKTATWWYLDISSHLLINKNKSGPGTYPLQTCSSCQDLFTPSSLKNGDGVLQGKPAIERGMSEGTAVSWNHLFWWDQAHKSWVWETKCHSTRDRDCTWCPQSFSKMRNTKIQECNAQGSDEMYASSRIIFVLCCYYLEWFISKPRSN